MTPSYVLQPGREYLLTLSTRRPLARDLLTKALTSTLGDILVEIPDHNGHPTIGAGRGGGGGLRAPGYRASPIRQAMHQTPTPTPPGPGMPGGGVPSGRRGGLGPWGPRGPRGPWWPGGLDEVVLDEGPLVVVEDEDDLSGRSGHGGGGGGRGGGGRGGGGRGIRRHSDGRHFDRRRRFGPGGGGWWWNGGGPWWDGVDEVIVEDDYPLLFDEDDIELAGGLLRRVRLIAKPTKSVALSNGQNVTWCPPTTLFITIASAPHIATSPALLEQGKCYDLRILSALSCRQLTRYLELAGFDLQEKPMRIRTSVRVSSLFPPLPEYVVRGAWTNPSRSVDAITPGFILEEVAEAATPVIPSLSKGFTAGGVG